MTTPAKVMSVELQKHSSQLMMATAELSMVITASALHLLRMRVPPKYCAKALVGMTLEPIVWEGLLFAAIYRGRVLVGSYCWQRDADAD